MTSVKFPRSYWARSLLSSTLLLAMALSARAQAPSAEQAAMLVQAMQLDKSALTGMQLSVARGVKNGVASPEKQNCVDKLRPAEFTDIFSTAVVRTMSQLETKQATEFFQSRVGQKATALGFHELHRQVGAPLDAPAPQFSEAELRSHQEFVKTSAGEKLLVQQVLSGADVKVQVGQRIKSLVASCGSSA